MEECGGGTPQKVVSFAKVVSSGMREVSEVVWLQIVSEQVLKNSELLKKCLVWRWGVSTDQMPVLSDLRS